MDIIIHVGLHKTATTSVQRCLHNLRSNLIEKQILYPSTGSSESVPGHTLFPGSLIPNHKYLNSIYSNRSLDMNYYLNELQNEIGQYNPKLVFLSSEVFCELHDFNVKDIDIISLIKKISASLNFESTKIFLSNRNAADMALSGLKHTIRLNSMKHDIFNNYRKHIYDADKMVKFWKNSGFICIEKFLENSKDKSITKYYLGDIFDTYSSDSSCLLSKCDNRVNYDRLDPCLYLLFFLMTQADSVKNTKNFFILARDTLEVNPELKNIVSNENLKSYLQFFIEPLDEIYYWSGKYNHEFITYEIEIGRAHV